VRVDGLKGDRLPGSPKHQANLFVNYEHPIANGWTLKVDYNLQAISNVLSRTGNRGGGISLPGYSVHNAVVSLDHGDWRFALYADNIFDKFAETGVTGTPWIDQAVVDADGGPVYYRGYFTNVIAPRKIGVRVTAKFGG
jgi:outer membrane receptor protein involved in Fe transport